MSNDYIAELMRKTRAIIACGAGNQTELARFIFKSQDVTSSNRVAVSNWVNGKVRPNGNTAHAIESWASAKTLEIDAGAPETKAAYRKAFAK